MRGILPAALVALGLGVGLVVGFVCGWSTLRLRNQPQPQAKAQLVAPPDPIPLPEDEEAAWSDYKRTAEWLKTYGRWSKAPITEALKDDILTKREYAILEKKAVKWREDWNNIDDARLRQQYLAEIQATLETQNDQHKRPE